MTAQAIEPSSSGVPFRAVVRAPTLAIAAPAGLAVAVFAIALVARTVGINLFVTPDEDNWMRRAANFSRALQSGRYQQSLQSGHPGVTTMWVASLGMGSDAVRLAGATTSDPSTIVTKSPDWDWLFLRARYAMVAASSALLALIAVLSWRLLGAGPAILGAIVMALEPFMVAHGQVVHVDALTAELMTVAVLAGGIFWLRGGRVGYLVLCGMACGLGVLTKAPSFFLGLFLPLLALSAAMTNRREWPLRRVVISLGVCGVVALVTVFACLPALWVAPIESVRFAIDYQRLQSATPHGPGNFFLGRPVADPGAFYYPVAAMFRSTPTVVVGLIGLTVFLTPRSLRQRTGLLVGFVLGFALFVTLASKKLDRYALPIFPSLALLAGMGFWSMYGELAPRMSRLGRDAELWGFAALVGAVGLAQVIFLASVSPYPLAFYNPIVGGGPAAQRVMLVGWGEGLDRVATYLNARPNADTAHIAIYYPLRLNFQGMLTGTLHRFGDPVPADYVVDYVNASQRGQVPREVRGAAPDHTVRINGIEYARIYRLDPPRVVGAESLPTTVPEE